MAVRHPGRLQRLLLPVLGLPARPGLLGGLVRLRFVPARRVAERAERLRALPRWHFQRLGRRALHRLRVWSLQLWRRGLLRELRGWRLLRVARSPLPRSAATASSEAKLLSALTSCAVHARPLSDAALP